MGRSISSRFTALAAVLGALSLVSTAAMPTEAQDENDVARRLVVIVRSLRSDRGQVVGGLYTSPRVWLGANRAAANCHASITAGEARCVFAVPRAQRIAFAGMHDEDSDGEFDRDLLGIPQEGYAFSNDARDAFGPPSFEAAAFSPPEVHPFIVHARYGI